MNEQRERLRVTVVGCGRWGSFLAYYLDRIGHRVTLYGRAGSAHMQAFLKTRSNGLLTLPESVSLSTALPDAAGSDLIVISVGSQTLRALLSEPFFAALRHTPVLLCMKGLEVESGGRLSVVARECLDPSCSIALWLGPGHVQDFCAGIPNCMVIDSEDDALKKRLVAALSSELIRLYFGEDVIGNELGAAAKNVIGLAAGMLDGFGLSSLKGALMARGAREVSRLIVARGGQELSAYGLCHLGDYEATVFSPHSHNRRAGEALVRGESFSLLAEGCYTAAALVALCRESGVEMPICHAVYEILYEGKEPRAALSALFGRVPKTEFYR